MKRELSVCELLFECQSLENRNVNINLISNHNSFSATYPHFNLSCSSNIDWDENEYLVLENYDNEDDRAIIKIEDIKLISISESSLGELFNVFEVKCKNFIVQLCLDETAVKCVCCHKNLDYQDRCFKIEGEGNYYTEGLDNCKIDGYICSDCLSKILKKDGVKHEQ